MASSEKATKGPASAGWAPWEDPAAVPHVRLDGVTKRFGDFTAVDNLTLNIFEGEFFSLLGPSGCGKTTILRMLAGFEAPSEGSILIAGQDVSRVPPHRRPVNMMFQSYALFPHMTVEKNIAFGLEQDGLPKDEVAQRVDDVINLVHLGQFRSRKPHQLSGGQKQRVALARSLVKRPKTLLLDEPLGALDKKLREETQFELVNIQEQVGITFIIVTHDQEEAMTMSHRIAVMDHGRIVQTSTPTDIYEAPGSRYVAEFIGDVNVFEGKVAETTPDMLRIESPEAGCPIEATPTPAQEDASHDPSGSVWVAVRPEKLSISHDKPKDAKANCMTGEVWDIGYLGSHSIFHVKLASGKMVTVAQTNRTRAQARAISWEDTVHMTWRPGDAVVLSA